MLSSLQAVSHCDLSRTFDPVWQAFAPFFSSQYFARKFIKIASKKSIENPIEIYCHFHIIIFLPLWLLPSFFGDEFVDDAHLAAAPELTFIMDAANKLKSKQIMQHYAISIKFLINRMF